MFQKLYQLDQFGEEAENTLSCLPPKLIKLTKENKYLIGAFVEAAKISCFNIVGCQLKHMQH
jgi:hypothetical protein